MIFKARCKDLTTYKDLIDILFLHTWLIKYKACVWYYEKESCLVKQLWVYLESLSVCIYYFCVSICFLYVDTSTYNLYANNSVRVAQIWLAFHEKRAATIFSFLPNSKNSIKICIFWSVAISEKSLILQMRKWWEVPFGGMGVASGGAKIQLKFGALTRRWKKKREREGERKKKREVGRE